MSLLGRKNTTCLIEKKKQNLNPCIFVKLQNGDREYVDADCHTPFQMFQTKGLLLNSCKNNNLDR